MAAENASNNDHNSIGNGNVPKHAEDQPQPAPKTENYLYSLILTIYDVIIFLGVSIGYILEVSTRKITFKKTRNFRININDNGHWP